MKKIDQENILEELKHLKQGQRIFIKIEREKLNLFKLAHFKLESYNNLFTSYINNTCEEPNEFNMQKFIDNYNEYRTKYINSRRSILVSGLSEEGLNYIDRNNIQWFIDVNLERVMIYKEVQQNNINMKNGKTKELSDRNNYDIWEKFNDMDNKKKLIITLVNNGILEKDLKFFKAVYCRYEGLYMEYMNALKNIISEKITNWNIDFINKQATYTEDSIKPLNIKMSALDSFPLTIKLNIEKYLKEEK